MSKHSIRVVLRIPMATMASNRKHDQLFENFFSRRFRHLDTGWEETCVMQRTEQTYFPILTAFYQLSIKNFQACLICLAQIETSQCITQKNLHHHR